MARCCEMLARTETAAKHGKAQVKIWRCSYDVPPPGIEPDHPCYSNMSKDHRCAELTEYQLPSCESLKSTRTLPFWNEEIPQTKEGKRVQIAAHGNSLLGIVNCLEDLSKEAIMEQHLPTGIPMLYELVKNWKPIKPMQFLGLKRRGVKPWKLRGLPRARPKGAAQGASSSSRVDSQAGHPPYTQA
ncbi:hypothetical protein GH733_007819 [Mirounga leonina]|nr:hypothetical protein GH733_007819 [Mirounga leonina]